MSGITMTYTSVDDSHLDALPGNPICAELIDLGHDMWSEGVLRSFINISFL